MTAGEAGLEFTDAPTVTSLDLGYIAFDTAVSPEPSNVGNMWWSADHKTAYIQLDSGEKMRVGQDHYIRVKNTSGAPIAKGKVVKFTGASGDTIEVGLANGASDEPYTLAGITAEEILDTAFGFVTQLGVVDQTDTSGGAASPVETWLLGDLLYLDASNPGYLTKTKPSAPNWNFPIAAVTRVNASSGRILVRAIPGVHLHDIIDVNVTAPSSNDILQWTGTTWQNTNNSELTARRPITEVGAVSYVLGSVDSGGFIYSTTPTAVTFTIDTDATASWDLGTEIDVLQYGAGALTIQAAAGVDLNGVTAGSATITAQYKGASLKKIGPNTWIIVGSI